MRITSVTVDDGLSQNEVTALLRDRSGYLWVGTRGGLNRYTGQDFDVYQHQLSEPRSLSNSSVECLLEDVTGTIWVGTKAGGISVFDPATETFTQHVPEPGDPHALPDARVIALHAADPRYIWVGTWDGGTARYDRRTGQFATLHPRLRSYQFYAHEDGELYAATTEGLVRFSADGHAYQVIQEPETGTRGFVTLSYDSATASFFLGSWGGGLFRYFPQQQQWRQYDMLAAAPDRGRALNCYRVIADGRGYCWISTWGGGLYRMHIASETLEYVPLDDDDLLADSPLYQVTLGVLPAGDGTLWVGTNGAGLLRLSFNAGRFNARQAATLRQLPVWSVLEDRSGALVVGAKGHGTTFYQSAANRPFRRLSSLFSEKRSGANVARPSVTLGVRSLAEGEDTYYGATNFGLFKFREDGRRWRVSPLTLSTTEESTHRTRLLHASVIFRDGYGYYWIGTQQSGLWRGTSPGAPEEVVFKQYLAGSAEGQLGSNRITHLLQDAGGRIWVATYGGVYRYRQSTDDFTGYRGGAHALSSDIVLCATLDELDRLWLGTPNGINVMTHHGGAVHFRHLTEADGLSNDYVQSLEADGSGGVWAATIRGLTKVSVASFATTRYYEADGLPTNSFMENVSFHSPSGLLYFGSTNGLVSFHPDSIALGAARPEVVLRDLKLYGRSVRQDGGGALQRSIREAVPIALSYDQDVVTLDYAALDFGPSKQISYAYRLRGLKTEWNEVADRRSVTYADLSPGHYTFEVRAARSGRNWGPITQLEITVSPPPWATPWAYCLYGSLIVALLYGYRFLLRRRNELRNRVELVELSRRKDAEIAESKANFFTNVTHELRTPLTLITGPVSELLGHGLPTRQQEILETVDRNAQRLLLLCNQLLDFRKIESAQLQLRAARGNFVPFVHEVTLSFREAARQRGIRLVFDCAHTELPLTYDRNQLEIVLCNLLSNGLKYTPAGTDLTVTLAAREEEWVTVSVRDEGPGISAELAEKVFDRYYQIATAESSQLVGTGIGLALARGIVQAHRGVIGVVSAPGQGSTFTVELRTGVDHFSEAELLTDFRSSDAPEHYLRQCSGPLAGAEVAAAPDAAEVLIVEDNAEIRGFLRSLLRPHYRLREAENGQRALELATERPPDLVLSDVMMPVLDGISLCSALREGEATGHLPIILLTARTSTVHQIAGYSQGADAYVTKPFDAGVLLVRIKTLLKQRRELKAYYVSRVSLRTAEVPIPDAEREWLEATIAYVEQHLDRSDLSRAEVATAMAMSESTFYRRLKAVTGQTWGGFVRSLRLLRAAQLLQRGKCSVADAAYQAGFSDLKHFRHCFREQFAKSPVEYRSVAPASPPE